MMGMIVLFAAMMQPTMLTNSSPMYFPSFAEINLLSCECTLPVAGNLWASFYKMQQRAYAPRRSFFPSYSSSEIHSWLDEWITQSIEPANKELDRRIIRKNEKTPFWLNVVNYLHQFRLKTKFYWGKITLHTLKLDAQVYIVF